MDKKDNEAFLTYHHRTKIIEPGETEKDVRRQYFAAGIRHARSEKPDADDPGSIEYANDVIRRLLAMSDKGRRTLFSEFCTDCGTKKLPCYCERDE